MTVDGVTMGARPQRTKERGRGGVRGGGRVTELESEREEGERANELFVPIVFNFAPAPIRTEGPSELFVSRRK